MSTLAIKKQRFIYLGAVVFTLVFGLVYEHFSHEVTSYFMYFAFVVPLVGLLVAEILSRLQDSRNIRLSLQFLAGAVIWLTLGCIFKGALEIYGTTNKLVIIFWIVGGAQMLAAEVLAIIGASRW